MRNIFEQAAEKKLRFNYKGQIGPESLFDLTQKQLSDLHASISSRKENSGATLIESSRRDDDDLRLDIIKRVFEIKQERADKNRKRVKKQARKKKIEEILEEKEEGNLRNMSTEKLKALLNEDEDDD